MIEFSNHGYDATARVGDHVIKIESHSPNPKPLTPEDVDRIVEAVPPEWLAPARNFAANDYPCPRCGKQLPQYGQGVHLCP